MNNRPLRFQGNINIKNSDGYIIGKIIKDKNVEDKEDYIQVLSKENIELYRKGYKGYIFEDLSKNIDTKDINYCTGVKDFQTLLNYDVVEIINNKGIRVLYRDDSEDNVIVVTNQCNSNCIMCPDSDNVRNTKENPDIKKLIEQIRYIPDDTKHITITGGEPGLLKENLIKLLRECREYLPDTDFLLLTNGRVFADSEFTNEIKNNMPKNLRIAIPIYADNDNLQDAITRTKGGFKQTVKGIKELLERKISIEIRIVVLKKNYKYLENIAEFIVKEFSKIDMVNIMALEMTGNAYKNRNEVWVNFEKIKKHVYNACLILIKAGILTNLYNFPICNIEDRLYSLARKSITDYKIRYKEECNECKEKEMCGGFFNSTINIKDIKVKPIK